MDHLKYCPFTKYECKLCNKNYWNKYEGNMDKHLFKCSMLIQKCKNCEIEGPIKQFKGDLC